MPSQIQNPPIIVEACDECDSGTISVPSYNKVILIDDNTDSVLTDERSDVTANKDVRRCSNKYSQLHQIKKLQWQVV